MGLRGPAPKPTELRLIHKPISKKKSFEPKPEQKTPKCPAWLDKEAKAEWRRVAPHLKSLNLITIVDGTALAAYCQAYSRWRQAEEALTKHGTVFKTPNGYIQQLPQVAIAQKYARIVRDFLHEFGLSPSARVRLNIPNSADTNNPMDEFDL